MDGFEAIKYLLFLSTLWIIENKHYLYILLFIREEKKVFFQFGFPLDEIIVFMSIIFKVIYIQTQAKQTSVIQ